MNDIIRELIGEEDELKRKQNRIRYLLEVNNRRKREEIGKEREIRNHALYKNIHKVQDVVEKEGLEFEGFSYDTYYNENIKIFVASGMYKYCIYVGDNAEVEFMHNKDNDGVWTSRIKDFQRIFVVYTNEWFAEERGF